MKFTAKEEDFLQKQELARLATISGNGLPHVVPVSYLYDDGEFLVAVDYNTKKYHNLRADNKAAIVVDTVGPNRGILVQGEAKIYERGPEFKQAYAKFYKRFNWVRANPWKEDETPFIRIRVRRKASWGL